MKLKNVLIVALCLTVALALAGCSKSEARQAMDSAVESANELLEKDATPYDEDTKTALQKAVESSEDASEDAEYEKATEEITTAAKAYEDSIKQLEQVTLPEESFLVKRAKTVDTITKVEAATEETDGNKLMNKEGGYYAYVAMKSSMVDDSYYSSQSPVEAGTDGGAVIEAFKTVKEAEARNTYLSGLDGNGAFSPGTHKVVGTLLVRTSNELTASQQKKLEKDVINALIKLED